VKALMRASMAAMIRQSVTLRCEAARGASDTLGVMPGQAGIQRPRLAAVAGSPAFAGDDNGESQGGAGLTSYGANR
jgi:hypothetical protein